MFAIADFHYLETRSGGKYIYIIWETAEETLSVFARRRRKKGLEKLSDIIFQLVNIRESMETDVLLENEKWT